MVLVEIQELIASLTALLPHLLLSTKTRKNLGAEQPFAGDSESRWDAAVTPLDEVDTAIEGASSVLRSTLPSFSWLHDMLQVLRVGNHRKLPTLATTDVEPETKQMYNYDTIQLQIQMQRCGSSLQASEKSPVAPSSPSTGTQQYLHSSGPGLQGMVSSTDSRPSTTSGKLVAKKTREGSSASSSGAAMHSRYSLFTITTLFLRIKLNELQ